MKLKRSDASAAFIRDRRTEMTVSKMRPSSSQWNKSIDVLRTWSSWHNALASGSCTWFRASLDASRGRKRSHKAPGHSLFDSARQLRYDMIDRRYVNAPAEVFPYCSTGVRPREMNESEQRILADLRPKVPFNVCNDFECQAKHLEDKGLQIYISLKLGVLLHICPSIPPRCQRSSALLL